MSYEMYHNKNIVEVATCLTISLTCSDKFTFTSNNS
jgi:hypothetical protein